MPARRFDLLRAIRNLQKSLEEITELPEKIITEPIEEEVKKSFLERLYSFRFNSRLVPSNIEEVLGEDLDSFLKNYIVKLESLTREDEGNSPDNRNQTDSMSREDT